MKKVIYLLLLFPSFLCAQKSYETRKEAEAAIKNDEYKTSTGWVLKRGTELKLGKGSMPDKRFAFVTEIPNLLTYNQFANYDNHKLQHTYNGRDAVVADLLVTGNKKSGFYIMAKLKVGQMSRYGVDVENAIEAGEIELPAEYKTKSDAATGPVLIKQEVSVADELAKLKKLYDDGILTKEEFEAQKKKLLERN